MSDESNGKATDLTVNIKAEFEGLGDVDAETRTIDTDVAETIDALIKQNLRNRYTDIDDTAELHIVGIEAPNVAVVECLDTADSVLE